MEISRLFTLSGHELSKRMEESTNRMEKVTDEMHTIAQKTARDSASMHVITIVTLILLPGTFLGVRKMALRLKSLNYSLTSDQTLFSTPIFNATDSGQSWVIDHGLLWLFIGICIPVTIVMLIAWYGCLLRLRRAQARRSWTVDAE